MRKEDLARRLAAEGVDSGDAKKAVDAVFETIASELQNGGEVAIAGFGKFSVSDRAARQGVNPATGEKIQIAATKAAKFSAASGLKEKLTLSGEAGDRLHFLESAEKSLELLDEAEERLRAAERSLRESKRR